MARVKIIHAISDIIDTHCKGCTLIAESGAGSDTTKRRAVCEKCEYGIELERLGDKLNKARKVKVVKASYGAYKDMIAQGMKKGEIATRFGISAARLSQLIKEWKKEAGEFIPQRQSKKKPGRPPKKPQEKEVAAFAPNTPSSKTPITQEDELSKLAYDLKEKENRLKQLEKEAEEKDKLIQEKKKVIADYEKVIENKSTDQANLMKENQALKDEVLGMEKAYRGKYDDLQRALAGKAEVSKKLEEAKKENAVLVKEYTELDNDSILIKNENRRLEHVVSETSHELDECRKELEKSRIDLYATKKELKSSLETPAVVEPVPPNEDEVLKLKHKVQCLENTLKCYM